MIQCFTHKEFFIEWRICREINLRDFFSVLVIKNTHRVHMCIDTVVSAPVLNEAKWFISYVRTLVNMFQSLTSCSPLIGYFLSCSRVCGETSSEQILKLSSVSIPSYLFLSVLFSQYCNASLDITQASLSCSASAESNLVQSAAARRIRLSFFRLLWNVPFFFLFFFSTSKIHKAAKLLTCVSGPVWLLHSFMPHYVKTPHCLFKEHWTL